jgi:hypothetical protein
VLRDEIIRGLRSVQTGLTTTALLSEISIDYQSAKAAMVESLLLLSPEITLSEGRWRLVDQGRLGNILAAFDAHVTATGRRVFRAASALAGLPPHEHPTIEELQQAAQQSGGRYELLSNGMVRRNT